MTQAIVARPFVVAIFVLMLLSFAPARAQSLVHEKYSLENGLP